MDKLELQSTCFENIKTLCVNYRKDSSSRKTVEYLNKRLSSLENQWQDFESRHAQLMLELEDKNIAYFKDDVYAKTKEMFLSTKTDITNKLATLGKRNVKFDLGGTSEDDDSNNIQILLNKQECNFNAIYRVISKIDVVTITERWELEDHFTTLKSKWEPIDKLHWEIDFQLKGSNEHYYQMFTDIEQKYDELKRKINAKIWSTVHYQKSTPNIEIPEFSGSYSQWISFKDLFLEAVHKNPMINNAQKMQHLKTKLRGEAERLVQHLTISTENYNSCWDILNQRYDNRRLQFTSFMSNMLSLPIIQHPDSFNLKKMHDVITECLNGISNIGIDTTTWDPIIVHIMSQKLDSSTLSDYMKELQDHRELPRLHDFLYFLETQFMAYETMKSAKKANPTAPEKSSNWKKFNKQTQRKEHNYNDNQNKTSNYHASYGKCPCCNGSHILRQCDKFLQMDFGKRNDTVSKLQLCKNCLFSHGNYECKSTKTCKECNLNHHTLLHNSDKQNITSSTRKNNSEQRSSSSTNQQTSNHLSKDNMEVLLTTVQLRVKSADGTYVIMRALLDQGSQVNLITENAAQVLRLPRNGISASVSGIGSVSRECRGKLKFTCQSIHSDYSFETQALIMTKLTNNLPTRTFEKGAWTHLENLKLADPDFNVSRKIDLLLGADVYSEIILEGVLKGNNSSPVAQHTQIGWILCGKMKQTFDCHATLFNLEDLTKFWENEEIQNTKDIPKDDQCEQFYKETVRRSSDGKYNVKMPLVPDYEVKLGKSRTIAVSQFLQLEKRLKKNEKLSSMYKQFMEEYADLGHMKLAPQIPTDIYFLPHHGVMRENSTTTKLRVVFNASQQTTSGLSLNNVMEKGANLQKDIQALILKWRTYRYAFTADIEKMYRCIWISKEQQHLQRIVWRDSRDQHLRDYQLCTVTYGTKCAPWLAMRTLKQLAIDDGHKHPEAAKVLIEECYVEDVISGHNNLTEAKKLQQSLIELLRGGGMNLRKWTANDRAIVEDLREDQISTQNMFDFKGEESTKTLGLGWNPNSDTFHFNWPVEHTKQLTKRSLLSAISRFYDPLGWLSPVTVKAKLLFQKLWMSKLNWDEVVPSNIESEWLNLKTELPYVKKITINRWIGDTQKCVELLGFCDASEKAYACVIYSKMFNEHGQPIITLLAARTRVTPLTQKTTLPRLELCGAQLLAGLMEKTKKTFCGYNITTRAWSDSQVVLAWIQGETSRWETYVANRVKKIKSVIPAAQWRYVKSELNPADCASRGLLPSKLMKFHLWWQGPELLTKQNLSGDIPCVFQTNIGCINHVQIEKPIQEDNELNIITKLLNKCSSLTQVNRVIAWILRFITNMRNRTKSETTYLTTSELSAARKSIIIHAQRLQFNSEYKQLVNDKTVSYVRVTTIKTQAGIIKRPITKLSPLPLNSEIEDAKEDETKNKPQQNSKNERRKRSKNPISKLLITILSLFTFVTGSYSAIDGTRGAPASTAQITSLERERPIYYDTIGKIQVVHDEWILMMYYNLTNYWEGTRRTQAFFDNIKNLCHQTNLQHCRSTMEQLNHEIELLNYYNSILINPHKHLSNRKKRGLVDGVGYIANSLFGILDQQFAEKYQNDIQSLQTNENYLLELIKNQTTIVELENQVLKQSEDNIQRQFNSIDNFINQTNMNIASIDTEMKILSATTYINSASLTTYLLINSLRTFQEMLFNTLTNVYQGHVDVHLITPVRLMKKLTEISGSLPKSTSLPVENYKENIKDIYKLINVKARVTENYFLFEAHIPLVANEDFDIYKAIPLPVNIAKETTYVQLLNKYIAVNFKKNVYVSMSEDDLKLCMQQKSQNFLCKKNLPSFDLHSKNAPCEAKLLSHQNSGPCDVERASCKDTWIELQTQNSWLAICCETCSLRIICSNDVTSQTISSSSIVTLPQGCVLQSTDLTIYSQRQYSSHMKMDYEFTAPTFDTSINKIVNLTYRYAPNTLQSKAIKQEIETIEPKIVTQKTNEATLPTITSHDIHEYAICYSLLTVAIIAVLVVVGRNRCPHYCKYSANNKHTIQPPEDIELQVIRKPEYQQEAVAAETTKDMRLEPQPGKRNIAFQFD